MTVDHIKHLVHASSGKFLWDIKPFQKEIFAYTNLLSLCDELVLSGVLPLWVVCLFHFCHCVVDDKVLLSCHISHCLKLIKTDFPLWLKEIEIAFVTTGSTVFPLTFRAGTKMFVEFTKLSCILYPVISIVCGCLSLLCALSLSWLSNNWVKLTFVTHHWRWILVCGLFVYSVWNKLYNTSAEVLKTVFFCCLRKFPFWVMFYPQALPTMHFLMPNGQKCALLMPTGSVLSRFLINNSKLIKNSLVSF